MTKLYGYLKDGVVLALNSEEGYAATDDSVKSLWIQVPSQTVVGSKKTGSTWTHPAPVAAEPATVRVPVPHFKMRFTPQERVAIKEASAENAFVADWLSIMDDPRLEYVEIGDPNLTAAIEMLVQSELLTEERAAAILA